MTKTVVVKPLGLVLRKAGLVSSEKIDKALKDSLYLSQYKLGEVLAIRGWIKPETAHFFSEVWPKFFQNHEPSSQARQIAANALQPLGVHLQAAGLLNSNQVEQILKIQKETSAKFGKIAVEQELISSTTLEFFLEHLNLIKSEETIQSCPESIALELDRVENYLINNSRCESSTLLHRYREVLTQSRVTSKDDLCDQQLLASGIVTLEQNSEHKWLQVAKPYYRETFNQEWIDEKLVVLRPYNQIRVRMFDLADKVNLPSKVIKAVKYWTNDQVFLTQKLLQIIQEKSIAILPGEEMDIVRMLVHKYIINDWQNGEAAQHLKAICYLLRKRQSNSAKTFLRTNNLLKAYKRVWKFKTVTADNSLEQRELLRIGLIQLYENEVSVSNLIYQKVFDSDWVKREVKHLKTNSQKRNSRTKAASQGKSKQLDQKSSNNLVAQSAFNRSTPELENDNIADLKNQFPLFGTKFKPKVLPLLAIATSIAIIPFNVVKLFTPKQPSQLLEQGNTLIQEQKYDRAIKTFDSLIEIQQKNPHEKSDLALAYSLKGKSQLKLHKYIQAHATYEKALHYNAESVKAKQGLGLAFAGLGQEDEANKIFENILQQSNISPEERGVTWWYWGKNFCERGNNPLANYSLKKALEFPTGFESEINSALKKCGI